MLLPLLIAPLMALLVCIGRGPQAMLAALTSSDTYAGLGFAGLIAVSSAAIHFHWARRHKVPLDGAGWPASRPCLMIGSSLLILWGPIGLLAQGLALSHSPRWLSLLALLLAHLVVTYPYVVQAVAAGRPQACLVPILAQSLGEFSATLMVCGNPHLDSRHSPLFIYSYYDPIRLPAVQLVCAVLSLLSLLLFASQELASRAQNRPIP